MAFAFKSEWPLLVIAPSSARFHWQAECLKWLRDEHETCGYLDEDEVQVLTGGAQPILATTRILIVSYDLVDRCRDALLAPNGGTGFRVIIADECHLLKNQKTKRSKAILPMLRDSSRAILLSGTPALSRPNELWSQLNVIDKEQWPTFIDFKKRYCTGEGKASNIYELHVLLRETCMLRRLKTEILKDLPPKTRRRVVVELEDPELKAKIFEDFREFLTRSGQAATIAKKKSRLMEIAMQRLAETESASVSGESSGVGGAASCAYGEGGDAAASDGGLSNLELAQKRKSLLMQVVMLRK